MARQGAYRVLLGAAQCTQATEGWAGESSQNPFFPQVSAQALVKADRIFVPVEDRPLHPAAAPPRRDPCELAEQRPAGPVAALLGNHEEILQVERRTREERREREEVEREANGALAAPADQRLEVAAPPEAVPPDLRGRGRNMEGQALVCGEAADEQGDRGDVAQRGA